MSSISNEEQRRYGEEKKEAEHSLEQDGAVNNWDTAMPVLPSPTSPVRGASAEEVLLASIKFKTTHMDVELANERITYPSLDLFCGEKKLEQAMVWAQSYYSDTDDSVMQKIINEERFMRRSRSGSDSSSNAQEDAKPPATTAAEVVEYDVHPADMHHHVKAEFIGEAAFHAPQQPSQAPHTVMATLQEEHECMEDEALVLDSKPAATSPRWSNEVSMEATVLSAEQPQSIYSRQHGVVYEEISVMGIDETEASVLEIAETSHPADLDALTGVEAELIGQEFTSQNQGISVIGRDEAEATVLEISDSSHTADLDDVTGVEAELIDNDFNSESQSWVEVATEDAVSTASAEIDVGYNKESHHADLGHEVETTFVEELHPADLERGVQAEMVGQNYIGGPSLRVSQIWAEPESTSTMMNASDGNAVAVVQASYDDLHHDPQTVVVEINEDIHPAELQAQSVEAELISSGSNRADPVSGTPVRSLSPGFPAEKGGRSVFAPSHGTNQPFHNSYETSSTLMNTPTIANGSQSLSPTKEVEHEAQTPMAVALPVNEDGSFPVPAPRESSHASSLPVNEVGSFPILARNTAPRETSYASSSSRYSNTSSTAENGTVLTTASTNSNLSNLYVLSPTQQVISNVAVGSTRMLRSTNSAIERLFGSDGHRRSSRVGVNGAGPVLQRTLLPWLVFPSSETGMWVATVNTDQKALDSFHAAAASKALRAFSVPTKEQAEALARAWAPPRMLSFAENANCFMCEARFGAVKRRPRHCRNCGVCICSGCSLQWPSKMIPDTYNIKKENMVNICKGCDYLCSAFRMAILQGDYDQAVAIHATGNVNLVTPFANVKGELFYPVHCAVLGGSLQLLQWLVDTHCCPLRSIRISGKTRKSSGSFTPILTSRGRSLLGMAMENEKVDLVRYLVVEKGMPLAGEKEMNMHVLIRMLDKVLRAIPSEPSTSEAQEQDEMITNQAEGSQQTSEMNQMEAAGQYHSRGNQSEESWRADVALEFELSQHQSHQDGNSEGSVDDACIICFANSIDCVVYPCGHQICCIKCSSNFSRCPVCGVECTCIRVYRANN